MDAIIYHEFGIHDFLRGYHFAENLFDWNPPERCKLPIVVPNVPAGVPSPVRFTPWKEAALHVLAQLREQGYITAKQVAAHGCGMTTWTQRQWLVKGGIRGQWVATDKMPEFDKEHPEAYSAVVEKMAKIRQGAS